MDIEEFKIGLEFHCGEKRWRCSDIGTRIIAAICVSDYEQDPSWLNGPPYACVESVFDEYDLPSCTLEPDE